MSPIRFALSPFAAAIILEWISQGTSGPLRESLRAFAALGVVMGGLLVLVFLVSKIKGSSTKRGIWHESDIYLYDQLDSDFDFDVDP